jgi:hypothetical protein
MPVWVFFALIVITGIILYTLLGYCILQVFMLHTQSNTNPATGMPEITDMVSASTM